MTDFISQLNFNNEDIQLFKIKEEIDTVVNPLLFKLETDIEEFEQRHSQFYKEYEKIDLSAVSIFENILNQMKRMIFVRIQSIASTAQKMIEILKDIDSDNQMITNLNQVMEDLRSKEDYLLEHK